MANVGRVGGGSGGGGSFTDGYTLVHLEEQGQVATSSVTVTYDQFTVPVGYDGNYLLEWTFHHTTNPAVVSQFTCRLRKNGSTQGHTYIADVGPTLTTKPFAGIRRLLALAEGDVISIAGATSMAASTVYIQNSVFAAYLINTAQVAP